MKKTLLLAAALACSGTVQAEIFSCTSTYGATIGADSLLKDGLSARTWIADTRRGLRISGQDEAAGDYSGECKIVASKDNVSTTVCTTFESGESGFFESGNFEVIKIEKLTTGQIAFKAAAFSHYNFAYAGFCTEI
jgi:hypothetical protein